MMECPIAVVGQGCVLPGANDPEAYWNLLCHQRSTIQPATADMMGFSQLDQILCTKDTYKPGKIYSAMGGFVTAQRDLFLERLHPVIGTECCGILLEALDVSNLWLLESIRQALSQNHDKDRSKTGVIVGNLSSATRKMSDYFNREILAENDFVYKGNLPHPVNRFMSGLSVQLAAKAFGFGKATYAIDATCASSLYAIELAIKELVFGRANLMIAGGVFGSDPAPIYQIFSAMTILSPSGRSRPFCRSSDGFVPGFGAAVVALKRLSDAIETGDTILGIIRSVSVLSRGQAGNVDGDVQAKCMQRGLDLAGIASKNVHYVECHANGDRDHIELSAIRTVFNRAVLVGSAKGNIGHTFTAAGAAGLIKVLMAMKASVIPPTLIPDADLETDVQEGAPQVVQTLLSWKKSYKMACINAFGFGGINATLVVQDAASFIQKKSSSLGRQSERNDVVVVGLDVKEGRLESVSLPYKELMIPPYYLKHALAQKLILLEQLQRFSKSVSMEPDSTGVYVGVGIDSTINRFLFQSKLSDLLDATLLPEQIADFEDQVGAFPQIADIAGNMTHEAATLLNSHYSLKGPGFTN